MILNTEQIKRLAFILLLICAFEIVKAQNNEFIENLHEKFTLHYADQPIQKSYLLTNKSEYEVGEKLFFKSFLLNALTHKKDTVSKQVYVQLVSPLGEIVEIKPVRLLQGEGDGFIELSNKLVSGNYKLYTYSHLMRNFSSNLIGHKTIYIKNKFNIVSSEIYKKYKKKNKKYNKGASEINVRFYPESGSLVDQLNSKIIIQAVYENGRPYTGVVYFCRNSSDNIDTVMIDKKGLGKVFITPEVNQEYFVLLNKNSKIKYKLPEIKPNGTIFSVRSEGEQFKCNVATNNPGSVVNLFAHIRDEVILSKNMKLNKGDNLISVNKENLKTGVAHFTLFDDAGKVLGERLCFVNANDFPVVSVMPFKKANTSRDSLAFAIRTVDVNNNPLMSNAVVYASNEKKESYSSQSDVIQFLLLESEVAGNINNPQLYFSKNKNALQSLDDFLITQKWNLFNWEEVVSNGVKPLDYEVQNGISVSGFIKREGPEGMYADADVKLSILGNYQVAITKKSDGTGYFEFNNLEYYGDIDSRIDVKESGVGRMTSIVLNKYEGVDIKSLDYSPVDLSTFIKKPNTNIQQNSSLGSISKIYAEADHTLYITERSQSYSSLLDAMRGKVPGMQISGGRIIIRGEKTFLGSTDPLVLVDGVTSNVEILSTLSPKSVYKVDVLSGTSASAFGSRGANGVICVYTKTGDDKNTGSIEFVLNGFQEKVNFSQHYKSEGQTIAWYPDVKTNVHGYAIIKIRKPTGKYIISIEGISNDGVPLSMSYSF